MKKFSKILVIALACSLLIVLCPTSVKASEEPTKYTLEEVSNSVGYFKISQNEEVKHVASAFLFYKDKQYTYVMSSFGAYQPEMDGVLIIGVQNIKADFVAGSATSDISIFKYKSSLYDADVLHFSTAALQEGQEVYAKSVLGYESDEIKIVGTQEGYVSKSNAFYCDDKGYLYNCLPLIQLDMYLTSTSHGAPIFNEYGYVVGMSSYKDPDGSGLIHALYSQELINFANRTLTKDSKRKADLGIYITDLLNISPETRESLGFEDYKVGVVVTAAKGNASSAGISINQLILSVNGEEVTDVISLIRILNKYNSGIVLKVKVLGTNGKIKTCKIRA